MRTRTRPASRLMRIPAPTAASGRAKRRASDCSLPDTRFGRSLNALRRVHRARCGPRARVRIVEFCRARDEHGRRNHVDGCLSRMCRIFVSRSEAYRSRSRRYSSSSTARSCGSTTASTFPRWRIWRSATFASYIERASTMAAFCSSVSVCAATPASASFFRRRSITSSRALFGSSLIHVEDDHNRLSPPRRGFDQQPPGWRQCPLQPGVEEQSRHREQHPPALLGKPVLEPEYPRKDRAAKHNAKRDEARYPDDRPGYPPEHERAPRVRAGRGERPDVVPHVIHQDRAERHREHAAGRKRKTTEYGRVCRVLRQELPDVTFCAPAGQDEQEHLASIRIAVNEEAGGLDRRNVRHRRRADGE